MLHRCHHPIKKSLVFNSAISFLFLLVVGFFITTPLEAVECNSSFVTTLPTIANWNTGWGAGNVTGWNYVWKVNGASGVYLGNNWVLTAGHVGSGTFTLSGTAYPVVGGSAHSITSGSDTADLTLFQVASGPSLSPMLLDGSLEDLTGKTVVMTGFGGGHGETWGANTISNDPPYLVTITGLPYASIDFETDYAGANKTMLVGGDSGGGDFIYTHNQWMLVGINEAVDNNSDSYMVQLGAYNSALSSIIAVPEPEAPALIGIGASMILFLLRKRLPACRASRPSK